MRFGRDFYSVAPQKELKLYRPFDLSTILEPFSMRVLIQLTPEHRILGTCVETVPILPQPACVLDRAGAVRVARATVVNSTARGRLYTVRDTHRDVDGIQRKP
ncbi:hypothetical protein EVAR_29443_1 [Eumeta japonica]|uniref:Uncharacterized protein n=1 Tax=Eumeta variegata TaxID=151549 RepID=A0A4C1VSK2_EUMVA|nr:hypothetical protein EVAR_29443_1 [Eumeta japonica]